MKPKFSPAMRVVAVIIVNIIIISIAACLSSNQPAQALSRLGSRGEEVRQIQTKLQARGFYKGKIDGIYGSLTYNAVKAFQKSIGITVDGIAGPVTLKALGITSSKSYTGKYSDSDYQLLARIISAEGRGEVYEGQVAIGAVILNRVKHSSFPDTIASVIYQPGAFTAITDGQINEPVIQSAYKAATDAMSGWDPSGGAIYYYNPDKTTNKFMLSRPVIKRIGKHLFCK